LRETQFGQNSRFARSHANADDPPPKFGITGWTAARIIG
jgi:hypothetical protein